MATAVSLPYSELENLSLEQPSDGLGMAIVIPAFAEEDIEGVLGSLSLCKLPDCIIEVIIIINEGADAEEVHKSINKASFNSCKNWMDEAQCKFEILLIYVSDIPEKIAGVGTARKIGMDIAALRLEVGIGLQKGIIINLDADCRVSANYFVAIWRHFKDHPKDELVSIAFEHRIDELKTEIEKEAIRQYEAYLHYFIGKQKQLGLPYAYQTIGSAFAVRAKAYLQVGGMNRRKAGEDFYFIHNFTKKGSIAELNTCKVFPSGRASFRVPFGTGRAVGNMLEGDPIYYAYHPESFSSLKPLIRSIDTIYHDGDSDTLLESLHIGLRAYLNSQKFNIQIQKLRKNSKYSSTFRKAFFQWFDAFRLMKYLNYMRDHYYPDVPVNSDLCRQI